MKALETIRQQYATLVNGPALIDRSYRALIEVTGKDRVTWVHNLTTNQVKTLTPGDGNYAFVLNVQGRILFDVHVMVQEASIWLDVDREFLPLALKHFNKYIIMEDVKLADRSDHFFRCALAGAKGMQALAEFGVGQAPTMASMGHTKFDFGEHAVHVVRYDFCGVPAADLYLPHPIKDALLAQLAERRGALWVDSEVVDVRRIEAGIPRAGAEITDDVLPAETRQLERAVSFQKGCYLGQEIVERMRARKVVARLLCGLRISGDSAPPAGAELLSGDAVVGKLTSICKSIALNETIGLGYVKSGSASPGTPLNARWNGGTASAVVAALPFVP